MLRLDLVVGQAEEEPPAPEHEPEPFCRSRVRTFRPSCSLLLCLWGRVASLALPHIKFLRSLAEAKNPRLIDEWPRATKLDRRRFELLKRAYVEARYSASYAIGMADLEALTSSVRRLRDIVEEVSRERLDLLRAAAEAGEGSAPLP